MGYPGSGLGFTSTITGSDIIICIRKFLTNASSRSGRRFLDWLLMRDIIRTIDINRIQGKSMLENKKLSDREILYQFLRRIPVSNRTIAYDIVNRDSNEKQDRKQVTTT